jgi:hypothetical protein
MSLSIDEFAALHTKLLINERDCELTASLEAAKVLSAKG